MVNSTAKGIFLRIQQKAPKNFPHKIRDVIIRIIEKEIEYFSVEKQKFYTHCPYCGDRLYTRVGPNIKAKLICRNTFCKEVLYL